MGPQVRKIGDGKDGFEPTIDSNPSYVFEYTGANLTQIDKTVGTITYRKTFGYTGNQLTSISVWVQI